MSRLAPFAIAFLGAAQLSAQAAPRDVDAYVTRSLKRFEQPGVAIAVVKDGKVVFQQGWGLVKQGEPARINEHTRFQVASNTKAMTAATLAMLVDEGKLAWDDPVADHPLQLPRSSLQADFSPGHTLNQPTQRHGGHREQQEKAIRSMGLLGAPLCLCSL